MDACSCQEHAESFWELMRSLPHWEFEIFLMLIVDGVVGAVAWPFLKRHWQHHLNRDKKEGV